MKEYIRKYLFNTLWKGLRGKPRLIQVIVGPRQVGKTTLALQVYGRWTGPKLYKTADLPNIPTVDWVITQWEEAREKSQKRRRETLLVLDEIQKIPRWSEAVKKCLTKTKD